VLNAPPCRGAFRWYARHGHQLGDESPCGSDDRNHKPTPTASPRGGWEGRRRRNRDPRDTNRIRGGAARASRPRTAKPAVIEAPPRRCGGCARKVGVLSYLPTHLGHDPDAALIPVADGTSAIRTSVSLRNPSPLISTPALIRPSASCSRSSEENTRVVLGRHPLVICHRAPHNQHMGPSALDQPSGRRRPRVGRASPQKGHRNESRPPRGASGARGVAERLKCTGLENRRPGSTGSEGSNPSPSADMGRGLSSWQR
jgi:hypothetical protein